MKFKSTSIFFIFVLLLAAPFLCAQSFVLAEGPISNTPSDSRSVNFIDLNKDGWEDIYISNGLSSGQQDLLYINDGTGNFNQVTDMDIIQASNPSDGASFADYNQDGALDGVVTSWYNAEDLLYINDGAGVLLYNEDAGIVSGSYAETAAFGDYDNDGWLDLYVTNSGGNNRNFLYRNTQDGKFERIENHILVNDTKLSRGVLWADFNNDGWTDLLVVNESNISNDLFLGQGGSVYEKVSTGIIASSQRSTMTASVGDIDNDGDFDLFFGNSGFFSTQKNQLFINSGGNYEEVTTGPLVETNNCTFGSAFGDYDNDGDLDLVISNGFCNTGLNNSLYVNQGDGTFADSSHLLSSLSAVCSFGIAWGDVNNDGSLDLMVANCKNNNAASQPSNALLINQGNENLWLKINLTGVQSNTSAIGARIRLLCTIDGQATWQLREIQSQTGYAGQNSGIAHFGLGSATTVDSILIDWPSGISQTLLNQAPNQILNITEDITNSVSNTIAAAQHLELFPNPLQDEVLRIKLDLASSLPADTLQVEVRDTKGKLFHSFIQNVHSADRSITFILPHVNWSAGIYVISIKANGMLICSEQLLVL